MTEMSFFSYAGLILNNNVPIFSQMVQSFSLSTISMPTFDKASSTFFVCSHFPG